MLIDRERDNEKLRVDVEKLMRDMAAAQANNKAADIEMVCRSRSLPFANYIYDTCTVVYLFFREHLVHFFFRLVFAAYYLYATFCCVYIIACRLKWSLISKRCVSVIKLVLLMIACQMAVS